MFTLAATSRQVMRALPGLLTATALGSIMMVAAPEQARATPAYAYASLQFTNFTLLGVIDQNGNPLPGISGVTNSVLMTDSANYPGSPPASVSANGNLVTGVDAAQSYSGPGPVPPQNTFTPQLVSIAGTRGDGLISGALAGGATSHLVAEGNLLTALSSAGSSAGSSTTIGFTTASGITIELLGSAAASLAAQVGQLGDSANAQVSGTFTVLDVTSGTFVSICKKGTSDCSIFVAPIQINTNVATTDPANSPVLNTTLNDFDYVADLTAGHQYQISLQDSVTTILSTVPEPASMAILGMGMVGLSALARRRSRR